MSEATVALPDAVSMPMLKDGDIIIPYRKGYPIILYENMDASQSDCFIRARRHVGQNVWYADVEQGTSGNLPRDPHHYKSQGIVVFVSTQSLSPRSGIRITRMLNSGKSARGTVIDLPPNWSDLYSVDTGSLFKPI